MARMSIPKDRLAVTNNYPKVIKDQALEKAFLTLFHPVVHSPSVLLLRIQSSVMISSKVTLKSRPGRFSAY